jgi:hypothetical protein
MLPIRTAERWLPSLRDGLRHSTRAVASPDCLQGSRRRAQSIVASDTTLAAVNPEPSGFAGRGRHSGRRAYPVRGSGQGLALPRGCVDRGICPRRSGLPLSAQVLSPPGGRPTTACRPQTAERSSLKYASPGPDVTAADNRGQQTNSIDPDCTRLDPLLKWSEDWADVVIPLSSIRRRASARTNVAALVR